MKANISSRNKQIPIVVKLIGAVAGIFYNLAVIKMWQTGNCKAAILLYKSLKTGGKILLRMGGQGDAAGIISTMNEVRASAKWSQYFTDFDFPFTFLGIDDYHTLLQDAGFSIMRVELIPKDMSHEGKSGLEGWIRTTWLPYTGRIPHHLRDEFIEEVTTRYLAKVPLDAKGKAHVAMVMIEVEAKKI